MKKKSLFASLRTGYSPRLIRCALRIIRLSFDCLNISVSLTVQYRSDAMISFSTFPAPTDGS